jgi:tetratricopeptide (TPR) repeat protein
MISPRRCCARHLILLWAGLTAAASAQPAATSYRDSVLAIQEQIQANHLEDARALLSAAFRQYPGDGGLDNLLGIVEIQEGHVERAKQAFAQAVLHSPKLSGAYLNLARIDMETAETNAADREDASRLYEKVLLMEPGNAEANYNEAVLLSWAHRYEASLQHLAKLDGEAEHAVRAEALACTDEAALGHKEAADRAAAALAANPELSEQDAMSVLPALRAAHRADLVDTLFTAANTRQPLSPAGLRILGLAEEAEGKPQAARTTLERVFALNPSDAAPLIDLTRIALDQKDYQGALGYLAHARTLRPDDASLPYEFGVICLKLNLLGEAARAMGEAVKLAPNNAEYNFGMGKVSSLAQDPSQALPYLKKYVALRPGDAAGALALGTAYFRNKDYDNASTWLNQAAKDTGTAAEAKYYLGQILREEGKSEDALAQLTAADRLHPDQPEILAELGQVYLQMRNYPAAEKELDRSLVLDPDGYTANFALLQLYAFNHDPRRTEQAKKFDAIKGKNEEEYRETMRVIEVRPESVTNPQTR